MEATIRADEAYRPLGFGAAFSRQFSLLWRSRRPLILMVAVLALLFLGVEPWNDVPLARLLTPPVWPLWLVLIGPVWAFGVWHGEGPSQRLYHWSQPVGRTAHSLGRTAAGAAWLLVSGLVLVVAALLVALLEGDAAQLTAIGPLGWINFFTGPLLGYLIVSVITISSDYPLRWFFGFLFLVPLLLTLLAEWLGMEALINDLLLRPIVDLHWGLGPTMMVAFWNELAEVHRVLTGEPGRGVGDQLAFEPGTWLLATLLWLSLWSGAVALMASRHPDVFPRWRRSR